MDNEISILRDYIKQNKLRWTQQRIQVLQGFLNTDGHVCIEELHKNIRNEGHPIGIATIYRTMLLIVECGLAREFISANGTIFFEKLYGQGHHDHLICTVCRKIVEFNHPLIEKYQLEVCRKFNFAMDSHRMNLYGECQACQKTGANNSAPVNRKDTG
jgi:Fur family ferric uptake transcriptional regulator